MNDSVQLTEVMKMLGRSVAELKSAFNGKVLQELKHVTLALSKCFPQQPAPQAGTRELSPVGIGPAAQRSASCELSPVGDVSAELAAHEPTDEREPAQLAEAEPHFSPGLALPETNMPEPSRTASCWGSLMPDGLAGGAPISEQKVYKDCDTCGQYYAHMMLKHHGAAPSVGLQKQDKFRANLLKKFMDKLATLEEKQTLLPAKPNHVAPTAGQRRLVAARLQELLAARVRDAYTSHGLQVAPNLKKGELGHGVNALDSRVRALKKMPGFDVDQMIANLGAWRTNYEQKEQEAKQQNKRPRN